MISSFALSSALPDIGTPGIVASVASASTLALMWNVDRLVAQNPPEPAVVEPKAV